MRLISLLKSKIHRATVTGASLHYEGSLTIDAELCQMVGLRQYERILVGNIENGERFETYVIFGKPGTGVIELNGATAHLGQIGDKVTIMNFADVPEDEADAHHPRIIRMDAKNRPLTPPQGGEI